MRLKLFTTFLIMLGSNINAQQKCGKEEMMEFNQKFQDVSLKEKELEAKFNKAFEKLALAKKWSDKQKAEYLLRYMDKLAPSMDKKMVFLNEFIEVGKQFDEKSVTEKNCEVLEKMKLKINEMLKINEDDWNGILTKISEEYKKTTNKDLILD